MLLFLGNSDALEPQDGTYTDGESPDPVSIPGDQVTTVEVPNGRPLDEALTEIKTLWALHSSGTPQWVDGNDDLLVKAVASTFGCPIGSDYELNLEDDSNEG
jgi:hypothetical protein